MPVRNVHERRIAADAVRVGSLIDTLASADDRLWPSHAWPRMEFDRPLGVGADGGHGPIRYVVQVYEPGRRVEFRFTAPRGFDGTHGYEIDTVDESMTRLRHVLEMELGWPAILTWPLIFRPLHDALIEDSLDKAEHSLGLEPRSTAWSWRVRLLRWLLSRGRAVRRGQAIE